MITKRKSIKIEEGDNLIIIHKLDDEYYIVSEVIYDKVISANTYKCDEIQGVMNLLKVIIDDKKEI
jgi:hypothetical protein